MLANPQQNDQDNKRVLKKVRTHFLAKKPENEENAVVPVPKPRDPYKMYTISGAWALVEQDRHIGMGIKYLNSTHDVTNVKIQDCWNSRQVILNLKVSNQVCLMPWEYSVKRLESYGNLELATMAHKIRACNETCSSLIEEHQRRNDPENAEMIDYMEKARMNVIKYKEKIENENMYPYSKVTFLFDKNGVNLHSFSFSEAILKEIDQSVEGFTKWVQSNGIPALYDNGSHKDLVAQKKLLSQSMPIVSEVKEEPEKEIYLSDVNGNKKRIIAQSVRICEQTKEGFLISKYTIIKNSKPYENFEEVDDKIKEEYAHKETKYVRYES